MMGRHSDVQNKLFYTAINLDRRIRKDHILRKINQLIDFDFIYHEVKASYGDNGNVSVPLPVVLKMMLLLVFYNVRSERELMDTIPERLDWLWFLGYDLDDDIPDHSILSKTRNRWGVCAFKTFFDRIVWQCVEAGLIDGSKIFTDASLFQADASNNSVVNQDSLKRYLNKSYLELEKRLEYEHESGFKKGKANRKYISTTDPDASVVSMGPGRSRLRYKTHRVVDEKSEIITATDVTPGEINEARLLTELIDQHEINTGKKVKTAVADSKYGTIDNYISCCDRDILPHFTSFDKGNQDSGTRKGIFSPNEFKYCPEKDCFICPAGEVLKLRKLIEHLKHFEYYISPKICNRCTLKHKCTRSKQGRTVKRHIRQNDLDNMLSISESRQAKKDIAKRQHLMERSYARSKRYGYKRARWRRLWRVRIQEYLTSTIQNIMVLVRNFKEHYRAAARLPLPRPKRIFTSTYIWAFYFRYVGKSFFYAY